ncbi:MAG: hypothetical protein WBL95_06620 [Microcoleus sp.]
MINYTLSPNPPSTSRSFPNPRSAAFTGTVRQHIAVLNLGEVCPMPYALCPMPAYPACTALLLRKAIPIFNSNSPN